jgi:DNA-binding transcriptional ArsR family regulator
MLARDIPHLHSDGPLRPGEAEAICSLAEAFAAPSRVRLLFALREGERAVAALAAQAGLLPAAASQQLRVLRHMGLVSVRRAGRSMLYRLHDDHVDGFLGEIRSHAEHARLGWSRPLDGSGP